MNTEDRIGCRCERGVALVIALMATVLLTALGSALILLSVAETDISVNYRNAQEALYGADAGIERAVQDLLSLPQWDPVLAGAVQSTFVDGTLTPTLPAGSSLDLDAATRRLQDESDAVAVWGANNPVWQLYAYGPLSSLLPASTITSLMYVVVWVADDPSECDADPLRDGNGVLTLRAEAYGAVKTRTVIEATMARSRGPDIEGDPTAPRDKAESRQGSGSRDAEVETVNGTNGVPCPDIEIDGDPEDQPDGAGRQVVRMLSWRAIR